jgi:peptidoglycan/LPS O-acetylase OafA/YrhL
MTLETEPIMALASEERPTPAIAIPAAASGRLLQLDVLRGIAVLLVLGGHWVVPPERAGLFWLPAKIMERFGWTGVDLFFVLSGFLVGGLLLGELRQRGSLDVKRFIIRRAFKIWPSYYALVLASLALAARHVGWRSATWTYLPNLLHLQNYWGVAPLGWTWSLAVEEHFYLAMPLLLSVLTAKGRNRHAVHFLPWIVAAVMVVCTTLRFIFNLHRQYGDFTHYFPTHLRIDGLAFGVLLAYLYHFRPELFQAISRRRGLLLFVGLLLVSPMARFDLLTVPFVWTIGFTMLHIGFGCILMAVVSTPLGPRGGWLGRCLASTLARVVALIGVFSYSIYLWHITLAHEPVRQLTLSASFGSLHGLAGWIAWTALYLVMAVGAGIILGKIIEFPALAVRDRLFPSRSAAVHRPV